MGRKKSKKFWNGDRRVFEHLQFDDTARARVTKKHSSPNRLGIGKYLIKIKKSKCLHIEKCSSDSPKQLQDFRQPIYWRAKYLREFNNILLFSLWSERHEKINLQDKKKIFDRSSDLTVDSSTPLSFHLPIKCFDEKSPGWIVWLDKKFLWHWINVSNKGVD